MMLPLNQTGSALLMMMLLLGKSLFKRRLALAGTVVDQFQQIVVRGKAELPI